MLLCQITEGSAKDYTSIIEGDNLTNTYTSPQTLQPEVATSNNGQTQ